MTNKVEWNSKYAEAAEAEPDERTEIIAKVSHELRTPLTAAQESLAIVTEELAGPLNPKQLEFLTVAQRNVHRLKRLIEDLLDLSPNQSEREPLALVPTDLCRIATAAIEARRKLGEDPVANGLDEAGPLVVAADFERMRQVICRLLDNAAYYARNEPVALEVRRLGAYVRLEVTDDGPGIPARESERIFEPFVQLGRSGARGAGRAGLGLTLARQFVERQGGSLWAEPRSEGGTRFVISLKLLTPEDDEVTNQDAHAILHTPR